MQSDRPRTGGSCPWKDQRRSIGELPQNLEAASFARWRREGSTRTLASVSIVLPLVYETTGRGESTMLRASLASRAEANLAEHDLSLSKAREVRQFPLKAASRHCFHLCARSAGMRAIALTTMFLVALSASALAAPAPASPPSVYLLGIPVDFIL